MVLLIYGSEEELKKFVKTAQVDRYYGINFYNLGNEKNTIEFRLPNGTIDAETWIDNINLYGGIVKVSEDLAIIQAKLEEERTDEENKILENFNKLKNSKMNNQEKLETLLSIVIPEDDRDIYRNRYEVNSELMEHNSEIKKGITEHVAKSSINVKKVAKKVFGGEEAITGQDYNKGKLILEKELQKDNQEKSRG